MDDGGIVHTGALIVLEGPDGVGKTTAFHGLVKRLGAMGHRVVSAREPGATAVGERIRSLTHGDLELSPRTELLLMVAARAALVEEVIRPALARGEVVVLDRFDLSTLMYQGIGRGIGVEIASAASGVATDGLRPDITVVLGVSDETRALRMGSRRGATDRIEAAGSEFHARVVAGYQRAEEFYPGVVHVDASGSREEVLDSILGAIAGVLPSAV